MHTAFFSLLPDPWAEGGTSKWINSYQNRDKQKFIVHPFRTHSWMSLWCLGCADLRLGPWSRLSHHGCAESPPEPRACASASLGRQGWSPGALLNAHTIPSSKNSSGSSNPQTSTLLRTSTLGNGGKGNFSMIVKVNEENRKKEKSRCNLAAFHASFPISLPHALSAGAICPFPKRWAIPALN